MFKCTSFPESINFVNNLAAGLWETTTHTMMLIGSVLLPFVLFALIVHRIERFVQIHLAERFGWKSVLWTGWLGTPIHELSHAFFCKVFQHRIDEMQLFEPDLKSGRLGYVKHSYRKKNWYQEIGNVFIGVAPLFGGTIALMVLLMIFYDDVLVEIATILRDRPADQSVWDATVDATGNALLGIFQWSNLATARFWVFAYLLLCVGNHMAPSKSDYSGAMRGSWMLALIIFGAVFVLSLASGNSDQLLPTVMEFLAPIFVVLLLAVILCVSAAILTFVVTLPFKKKYFIQVG